MVVGVGFCKIKVDSNFLLVLKIKCTKFHQDRSKTVDLHTKYTNRHSVLYVFRFLFKTFFFSNPILNIGWFIQVTERHLRQKVIFETIARSTVSGVG
jgi:hypothetical protein